MVRHLAEQLGASLTLADNNGRSPLYAAAGYSGGGYLEVVQWLAGNGGSVAQPADDGTTPLWTAAYNGHFAAVQWLAGHGGSVTQPNNAGITPLWAAAQEGHLAVVQWLAGNGGSVAQPANAGITPLWAAAYNGQLAVVQWLAGNGGSVAQPDNAARTPLSAAAYNGQLAVVQWLAGNGGSVAQPDNAARIPLLAAAYTGHLAVVQWVAGNGGSVTQPSNTGRTAVTVAAARGHDGIAAFLTTVATWPAFKTLVACRLTDDAKRALRAGRLDPGAGPTSFAELVRASAGPKDALWAGSPDACPAACRLVNDAMGPWVRSRHFLLHAGVRTHIRVVLLSGNRVRGRHDVPPELWEKICSFFLRSDWEAPVA